MFPPNQGENRDTQPTLSKMAFWFNLSQNFSPLGFPWPLFTRNSDAGQQDSNTGTGGSSSSSTPVPRLDLSPLGPMGPAIATILDLQDEADFGLAFADADQCLSFLEDIEREKDGEGNAKFADFSTLDKDAFVARWRMALTRTPATINTRAKTATNAPSSSTSTPSPAPPQTSRRTTHAGRYFGQGSVAPGRGEAPGLVEWSARTNTTSFSDKERAHLEYVLSVYNALGSEGTAWHTADSPEEITARETIFLHRIQRFAEDLGPKISAWKRWTKWCLEQTPVVPCFNPKVVSLGAYLMMRAGGGKTAAAGQRNQLRWWAEHVGVRLPVEHTALDGFKRVEVGHVVDDGEAPEPWMLLALMRLASQNRGTVSLTASIFTVLAGTCLRWRHIQRAQIHDVTDNAVIFWIAKGKTCKGGARHPFLSPAPRHWFKADVSNKGKDADAIAKWAALKRLRTGEGFPLKYPFLVPKIPIQKREDLEFVLCPDSSMLNIPMSYPDACLALRALLTEVGVPEDKAGEYTIKSLRKFLPTGASLWQQPPEFQNAIGDWQDTPGNGGARSARSRVSMPQTYNAAKIDVAYRAKKQIVSGICRVAEEHAPPGEHTLSQFLADTSGVVNLHWLTWDYITHLNLAHKDDHTFLVQASGSRSNVGKSRREDGGNPTTLPSSQISPPAKRAREPSPSGSRLPDTPTTVSPMAKSKSKVGPRTVASSSTPGKDEDEDSDSTGDSSTSSEEEADDAQKQAHEVLWFTQPGSNTAHFYRSLDEKEHPVPFCRATDALPEVEVLLGNSPSGATGEESTLDDLPRRKSPPQGFSRLPENLAEGYQLLLMTRVTPCRRCLRKLPEAVAAFFTDDV